MKKTFFTNISEKKRFFYYLLLTSFVITTSFYLGGCTAAKEPPPVENTHIQDSINIYTAIENSLKEYKHALVLNEAQSEATKETFENSLTILKKVDNRIIDNPKYLVWKKDYAELSKSIVQDYLFTQSNISGKSEVFKFAKRFGVEYEEKKEFADIEAKEELPNGSDIPLIRNKAVDEYIDFFSKTDRGRGFIDKTLYRSGKYFPIMRKILRFYNVPEELIYLSVQESGLNPVIVSRAGATGLWQFMATTGSAYGLTQDDKRDDRRDFEKSTDAAARHLKDLYKSFGDWYLAFAAYNAGPGRVTAGISKSGSKDYWEVRNYLPGETKNYVPSILALSFIFRNPGDYGFKNVEYGEPVTYDRVNVKGEISLTNIAEYCNSDIETIHDLNPELTQESVPSYTVPYQLRIPHGTYNTFSSNYRKSPEFTKNESFIPEYAGNENKGYQKEVANVTYAVKNYDPGDPRYVGSVTGKKKLSFKFNTCENLCSTADSFYVRSTDIRIWNNFSYTTFPMKDQELIVYLGDKSFYKFTGIKEPVVQDTAKVSIPDSLSRKEFGKDDKKNLPYVKIGTTPDPKDNKTTKPDKTTKTDKPNNSTPQIYVVKDGDYLSKIAENYNVSLSDLKAWNNLEGDKIFVGQKIKIFGDKIVPDKKDKKEDNTKSKTVHIVESGETLSGIADNYGVTVDDLVEWNNLESNKILVGQKLTIIEPKLMKKTNDTKKSKTTTHTVKEGENLTMIADKYGVDVEDIKDWNNLKSNVIKPGQTLIVSEPKTKDTKDNSKTEKTYKVKKGDTLQTIADDFEVTIKDLKKWNDLDSDTIMIGQVLIVSPKKKK